MASQKTKFTIMFQEQENFQPLQRGQRFLLEFVTVLFFIVKSSLIPVVQQYVYFLVDKKYNFTEQKDALLHEKSLHEALNDIETGNNVNNIPMPELKALEQLSHKVNEESSIMVLYLNIAELLPSAVVVLILGAHSDTIRKRKFMMWLPCLGNAVYALGFVLPIYVCNGNIDKITAKIIFVVAALCSGLFGNVPTFLSGNASYICDTDTPERRTLRLSMVELNIGLTFGIANFVHGFWINATDHYEQPLWFLFALSMITFAIIFFCMKEPSESKPGENPDGQRPSIGNLQSIKRLFKYRSIQNKKLWYVIVAYIGYIFVQQGQERTYVLFLQSPPLYYRSVQIGCFFLVMYALGGLASWPGVPLLQKCVDDTTIAIIGLISKIAGSLITAFASGGITLYIASVAQMFHLVPFAVARSIASRQVGDDEQGSVFGLIHSAQAIIAFLGPVLHNAIFTATLRWMSGFVFLVSGPLLVIPVSLLLYTKYLDKDETGYKIMETDYLSTKSHSLDSMNPLSETTSFASIQQK